MKTKETKINIEVNIYGTRFTVTVPFSGQDAVRATEAQMKAYFKELREKYSTKSVAECLAMMAYRYASQASALNARLEEATASAEDLLDEALRLSGGQTEETGGSLLEEYGEY